MGSAPHRRVGRLARHAGRTAVAVAVAGLLTAGASGTGTAAPEAVQEGARTDPTRATGTGLYVVTLTTAPSAGYNGGAPGHAATQPKQGDRFDRTRPAVRDYEQHLIQQQDEILSEVGDPHPIYRYTTAVNGFAVQLSTEQVKALRATEGVALVEKSTKQHLDTVSSPDFLGLTGPNGAWARTGGPDDAGRNQVVGVIDSGIWPENPSFAGLPLRSPDRVGDVPGFHGACQEGEQWSESDCSAKVVSARYFVKGFGAQNTSKTDYLSARDGSGHGSHAASVAAGNDAVAVTVEGQDFGEASGVAPAARIAAYKACWVAPDPDDDGCSTADTVAAIDQAVADGVDVINYSISGTPGTVGDSVELAFLRAAEAGVFVATSAGNAGPTAGTVNHTSPWVTTVGAGTHTLFQGAVALGNGESYVGAMVADERVPTSGLVLSSDVPAGDATSESARLCEIGSLDASAVQDKIVVCDRGLIARVEKSEAVARAGGAGMILANTRPDSVDADFHSVPSVHVDSTDAAAIKEYAAQEGSAATARLDATGSEDTDVPQIAGFSSRGPSLADGGDVLKPDLVAPGVSVLAAVAPPTNSGRLWDLYSGTSTSAPHVAGLAAFVQGEHPDWTPVQIKSAMMTTAYDLESNDGPFTQGAGHVDATDLLDPVLVYGSDAEDWRAFLAGQGFTNADGSPVSSDPMDGSELNVPSIAVGDLTGVHRVTRTVTNVSDDPETFEATVAGLDGIDVDVRPAQILLGPDESKTFTVTFRAEDGAQAGTYAQGSLTWTGLTGQARIPVVVRPQAVSAPEHVTGEDLDGSVTVNGRSGVAGPVELTTTGLVGALPAPVSLVPGRFDPTAPRQDEDTLKTTTSVPPGTEVTRFAVEANAGGDDLDMFVYQDDELVARSAGDAADESITLVEPEPGSYDVYVSSHAAANTSTSTGRLFTWVVGDRDAGNLNLSTDTINAGADAGAGNRFSYDATWNTDDLDLTQRWFGSVRYGSTDHRTFVTVD